MHRRRLSVPRADRSCLIAPPLAEAGLLARRNSQYLDQLSPAWPDRPFQALRRQARIDLADAAAAYAQHIGLPTPASADGPVIMTGHQPTLYHPGVWFKNVVCHALGRHLHGSAWNVIVDNDVPKSLTFRVPSGSPSQPHAGHVRLDNQPTLRPFEEMPVASADEVRSFGRRVEQAMRDWPVTPLAAQRWSDGLAGLDDQHNLADAVTMARCRAERHWGMGLSELPVSALADRPAFQQFVAAIAAHAHRFADAYNGALADYRDLYRVRSPRNPLPDLRVDADRCELPFWVWCAGGSRARLFIARSGGAAQLFADQHPMVRLDGLSSEAVLEGLAAARDRGCKIRPRALTLTLFCRLFVADLFIHGIGGAAYDRVTDRIAERFLDVQLPPFLTVSATLHMPVAPLLASSQDIAATRRQLRDLVYNPDRHIDGPDRQNPHVVDLVEQKQQLIRRAPTGPPDGPQRFVRFRSIGRSLQPWVADHARRLHTQLERLARLHEYNQVLTDREYTFWAYPEDALHDFYTGAIRDALGEAPTAHPDHTA